MRTRITKVSNRSGKTKRVHAYKARIITRGNTPKVRFKKTNMTKFPPKPTPYPKPPIDPGDGQKMN